MALIHSYFVDIFLHGKLLHSSASRTHVTIYDVKKCQQNTRESMPNCYSTYVHFDSFYLKSINHVHSPEIKYIVNCISKQINYVIHKEDFFLQFQKNTSWF